VLHVRVAAPPVEGRANAALIELLAKTLGVSKSRVSIEAGQRGREKVVWVEGLDDGELRGFTWSLASSGDETVGWGRKRRSVRGGAGGPTKPGSGETGAVG